MGDEKSDTKDEQPDLGALITLQDASKLSGFSTSHLRLLARTGAIWATRLGHNWLTTEQAIKDYLSQERKPGPKPTKGDKPSNPEG